MLEWIMLAAMLTDPGGPRLFAVAEIPEPVPGPGAEIIDVTLAGVGHADLHVRRGGRPGGRIPAVLGADVVGRHRTDGRRMAALLPSGGGYAWVAAPLRRYAVEVPDSVTDEQALAVLTPGLTAWHSLHTLGRIDGDDQVVVTAGAGETGLLAVQLARWAGARVLAIAPSPESRAAAMSLGAHLTVDAAHPDPGAAAHAAFGAAPTLVLHETGGPAFAGLREALAPFGRIVVHRGPGCGGTSAGNRGNGGVSAGDGGGGTSAANAENGGVGGDPGDTIAVDDLMAASTGVLGFDPLRVLADEELYRSSAARLFHLAGRGVLRALVGGRYPLGSVGQAHADLEAGITLGRLLIEVRRLT
jgi:NADPH2:quinone reductase